MSMTEQELKEALAMSDTIGYWLDLIESMEIALGALKEANSLMQSSETDASRAQVKKLFEEAKAIKQNADRHLERIVYKISLYDKDILSRAIGWQKGE